MLITLGKVHLAFRDGIENHFRGWRAVVVEDPVEARLFSTSLVEVAYAVRKQLICTLLGGLVTKQLLCLNTVESTIDKDRCTFGKTSHVAAPQ